MEPVEPDAIAHPEFRLSDPRLYINRQLSWLAFNERVLAQSQDPRHPLLERVRFVAISSTNLDEFFMIRVSGLQRQVAAKVPHIHSDGLTPEEQLARIQEHTRWFLGEQRRILCDILLPELEREGVCFVSIGELKPRELKALRTRFSHDILPILTPLAIDPSHPFPHISNLSLNLLIVIHEGEREFMARVKVPTNLSRFLQLPAEGAAVQSVVRLIRIEEVIADNLDLLFPGKSVTGSYVFQITRDADIVIQETEATDLLEAIEDELDRRQFGDTVRLVVGRDMPQRLREWLALHLRVPAGELYETPEPLGLQSLAELTRLEKPLLLYPPTQPRIPPELQNKAPILSAIEQGDLLLYHPYDSFVPVVDFVRAAASDSSVLAIKQTLYRVGPHSPIVESLLQARVNDVQVAATVELKARFDEDSNIEWARQLESDGVHVAYGMVGLKTHCKVCLIVRQEETGLRRYAHLGTGNYNPGTARVYTDFSFFTDDPEICEDVSDLFNYLTGHSSHVRYKKLLVAPYNFRLRMLRMINRQRDQAKAGRPARLKFKMNGLNDTLIIKALYSASRAGVKIDLLIRGACCLRPGIPGVSENIRVVSIVGRFLEHARVYAFGEGDDEKIYLGSGDLMDRNLDERVEALFPLGNDRHRKRVESILNLQLADTVNGWELQPDGQYFRVLAAEGKAAVDSQALLLTDSTDGRVNRSEKPGKGSRHEEKRSKGHHHDEEKGAKPHAKEGEKGHKRAEKEEETRITPAITIEAGSSG